LIELNLDAIKLKCFTIVDRHHEVDENIDRTEPGCNSNRVKMFHYSGSKEIGFMLTQLPVNMFEAQGSLSREEILIELNLKAIIL
jgi:hypothetical protein